MKNENFNLFYVLVEVRREVLKKAKKYFGSYYREFSMIITKIVINSKTKHFQKQPQFKQFFFWVGGSNTFKK
jgi:hypothetical protein